MNILVAFIMKIRYLLPLFIAIVYIACKKGVQAPPEDTNIYWGVISVNKNGTPWIALPSVRMHTRFENKLNFSFTHFDENGFKRERCGVFKVPAQPGTYSLHNTSIQVDDSLVGSTLFYTDDDLLLGYYDVLEADSSSFVTITSFDSITKEVRGNFEIIYKVSKYPFPGAPDTIRMQNGIFYTKIL